MIMKILTFPDPKLREVSEAVKEFGPEIKELSKNLLETMYDANGIGLATPKWASSNVWW